jgi:hypothetical protein
MTFNRRDDLAPARNGRCGHAFGAQGTVKSAEDKRHGRKCTHPGAHGGRRIGRQARRDRRSYGRPAREVTKSDPAAGGRHHYLDTDQIDHVEQDKVCLNIPGEQAMKVWQL